MIKTILFVISLSLLLSAVGLGQSAPSTSRNRPNKEISKDSIVIASGSMVFVDTMRFKLPSGAGSTAAALHPLGYVVDSSLVNTRCPLWSLVNVGKAGYLTGFYLEAIDSALNTGTVQFDVFYDTTNMTYIPDNAANALTGALLDKRFGSVTASFTTQGTSGAAGSSASATCLIPYALPANATGVYMRISTVTACTFKLGGWLKYGVTSDHY